MSVNVQLMGREVAGAVKSMLETLPRAIRLAADQMIGRDPVAGLVEAITNADDAYGDERGRILIRVSDADDGGWVMTVADRAIGLTLEEMKAKLGKLGARASGHEHGESKRGNRGRGIRDAASLGMVVFEAIKDGEYAWLRIDRNGEMLYPPRTRKATDLDRERLGVPHNGFVVHIHCSRAGRVHKPQMDKLRVKLEHHVQLRGIMTDPTRQVVLEYAEKAKSARLRYQPPAGAVEHPAIVFAVPGYGGKATMRLYELQEPIDEEFDAYRQSGLLLRSGRAVHEATLFRFDNNPWARCFFGEVRWDTIDDLIRDFDERDEKGMAFDSGNDRAIVRLDRSGLDRQHPAVKALKTAVETNLAPHFERRDREAGHARVHEETQRRLDRMGKTVTRFMLRKQSEYEIESLLPGQGDGAIPATFAIIPGALYLEIGETRTLTLRLLREAVPEGVESVTARMELVADPEGCGSLGQSEVKLTPDLKRPEFLTTTFDVVAGRVPGELYIVATAEEFGLDAETRVHIEEPPPELPPEPPVTFDFEQRQYSVADGKKRHLRLLAPPGVVRAHGTTVRLTNSNTQGVLIRQTTYELRPSIEGMWYEIAIEAEGRQHGASALLTAMLGSVPATTTVKVGRDRMGIRVRLDALKAPVPGMWDEDSAEGGVLVTINASHPAHTRYFGPPPDFPYQRTIQAQMLVAEVLAWLTVRQILQGLFRSTPVDIGRQYLEQNKLLHELRPLLHRDAISDEETERAQSSGLQVAVGLLSPLTKNGGSRRKDAATHSSE